MKRHHIKLKTLAALIACAAALPLLLEAQTMTSTNYRIPFDDLSGAGSYSSSSSYKLTDTVSEQATPTGEDLSSTNYKACSGFECLTETPFLTTVLATSTSPCTATTSATAPFAVALGTLSTSAVTTGANHVCIRATTNASGGAVASVADTGNGLKSTATPSDVISAVNATLTAGTAGYGICAANAQNGFSSVSPFNGSCDTGSGHAVGGPSTTAQTVFSATGPINNAYGDVLVKAAISSSTPGHADYADTLTFIVTATY